METSLFVVKLQYRSEIRRVAVADAVKYDRLKQLAHELFSTTSLPDNFLFQYKDSEGDAVSVSSERELEEAIRVVQNNNPTILKLEIKSQQKNSCGECCFQKFFAHCRDMKDMSRDGQRCSAKKFLLIPLLALLLFKPCLIFCLALVGFGLFSICAVKRFFCYGNWECSSKGNKCYVDGSCVARQSCNKRSQCLFSSWCSSTIAPKSSESTTIHTSEETVVPTTEGKQEREEDEKAKSPFESKLKQLEEMGFRDRSANIALLIKHNGNLLKSVKELLDESN